MAADAERDCRPAGLDRPETGEYRNGRTRSPVQIRLMSERAAAAGRYLGPLSVTDGGRGPKEIVVEKGEGAPEAASDAVLRESFRDGSIVNGPFNPGIGK